MTEEFEIRGEWYLPTSKEKRVYGILTYHPQDGIDLELYGNLNGECIFPKFKDHEIILGLTSDSKQVTLYKCNMMKSRQRRLVHGESGKHITTYSIIFTLIGLHVDTVSDLKFNKISSEIFNLEEWIGISGFNNDIDYEKIRKNEMIVDYKLPEAIEFEIDSDTKGSFNFTSNNPMISRFQKTVTITQKVEFQAKTEKEKGIDELLDYITKFQNFLTLAFYKSTYPLSITLSGERHNKDHFNGVPQTKTIMLYFSSSNFKVNEKPKFGIEMIFDYKRIKNDFQILIKNWFSKYSLLEPAFNLVFEQFYNGNQFTVNTFLNLAQSAETFHARVHNHTRIPRGKYKIMKEEILKVTPSEYHAWLNDQFNFGNNLNLHTRLCELTEKYSNQILDKILGDKNQFVLNVKNARNYYTHYSKTGRKKL